MSAEMSLTSALEIMAGASKIMDPGTCQKFAESAREIYGNAKKIIGPTDEELRAALAKLRITLDAILHLLVNDASHRIAFLSRQIYYKPNGLLLTMDQLRTDSPHRPLTPEIIMVYRHAMQTELVLLPIPPAISDRINKTLEAINF